MLIITEIIMDTTEKRETTATVPGQITTIKTTDLGTRITTETVTTVRGGRDGHTTDTVRDMTRDMTRDMRTATETGRDVSAEMTGEMTGAMTDESMRGEMSDESMRGGKITTK